MLIGGCGSSGKSVDLTPPPSARVLQVSSPDLAGGSVPRRFTCDGAGARPPLRWTGVPSRAVELAVVVEDPDAPGGTFLHWTVWGLPASAHGLTGGALPAGARQGKNSAGTVGWTPPCPPRGSAPHRYVFRVYALSKRLSLAAGAAPAQVDSAVRSATIAGGSLTARYGR